MYLAAPSHTFSDQIKPLSPELTVLNLDKIRKEIGYPQAARDAGIQGSLWVRVWVDEEGKYMKHKLLNQVHQTLASAVERQIPNLTFSAVRVEGKAAKSTIDLPFNFRLLQ